MGGLKDAFQRFSDRRRKWKFFEERPTPAAEVCENQTSAAVPSPAFFVMLALSAVIATSGLIASSAATIIGAMIIAPLMQPIGAMAYGLASTKRRLLLQATLTMVAGVTCTVSIAYLATILVGVQTVGTEIVGRTAPTLLDLVVAMAAGTAGAVAATRRSISDAIPGVAIAVALVPPLCVVGIGLALGKSAIPDVGLVLTQGVALGAMLLFLTNLAGIVFSGALVFVVQGYGRWNRALGGIAVSVLVMAVLSYPLMFSLERLLTRQAIQHHLSALRYERPEIYQNVVMRRLAVDVVGDIVRVDVEAIVPRDLEIDFAQETERIRRYLSKETGRSVEVKATLIQADIFEVTARAHATPPESWPEE